jgi:hypothetical protein
MSDLHQMTKTTPKDFIAATLGGLLAPGLTIFMIVMLFLGIQRNMGQPTPRRSRKRWCLSAFSLSESRLRLIPMRSKIELTGEQVYNEVCAGCHASGALDFAQTKKRRTGASEMAQGYETLLTTRSKASTRCRRAAATLT